jgi:hypothetical protein
MLILRKKNNLYSVINKDTGVIHSKGTTYEKAKAQIRIINNLDKLKSNYNNMDAQTFKHHMKSHGITLKKVRGHPLHQIMHDGLHHSYHPTRAMAKKEILGSGFFKDFQKGFKKGFHGAMHVAKHVAVPLAKLYSPEAGRTAQGVYDTATKLSGGNMSGGNMSGGRHVRRHIMY